MPLYVSIAMIREKNSNRVFNHTFAVVAATEDEAIERAKADLSAQHGGKEILNGSLIGIDPAAIREAYAELSKEGLQ